MKNILLLFAATLILSCNTSKETTRNFDGFDLSFEKEIITDFAGQQIKYSGNHLFIYDLNTISLKKLDAEGNVIQSIGRFGEGPGEFQSILDWDLINDSLTIVDDMNHSISVLDKQDSLVAYYKFPESITRAVRLSDNKIAIKVMDDRYLNQLIKIYSLEDSSLMDVNNPNPLYNDGGFGSDGFLLGNSKDDYIHLSVWTGDFFKFNQKGELIFAAKTIDKNSTPPKVAPAEMGMFRLEKGNKLTNINGALNDEYLFVLSRVPLPSDSFDPKTTSIVDVYSLENGNYISSFLLPVTEGNKVFSITLSQSTLYCMQGEKIMAYKIQKKN